MLTANKILAILALGASAAVPAARAQAPAYPTKPVKLMVAFAPGGATDFFGRLIGEKLQSRMGQPFVVENRVGAGGAIAAAAVARSPADGYTLLVTNRSFTTTPVTMKVAYDAIADFEPVGNMVTSYWCFASSKQSGLKTLRDMVDYARSKPGKLTYGSIGIGSQLQLETENFFLRHDLKGVHVPYTGVGPAITALARGDIDILFTDPGAVIPMAVADKVNVMAVAGPSRLQPLPDVATAIESGFPDLADVGSWQALFAPKGTPVAILDALNRQIADIMALPEVRATLPARAMTADGRPRDTLGKIVQSDMVKWTAIAEQAGIKLEQ
ncbi:tripartite tricarboxylate transporter substrate binding protein [Pigmentiphaga soli]|uniref:Tripartite tricarboxylate transporter substrate binding protein n=1 Tax=Pigmentiphaga soli TaxID=1007095 RepID=A0ABP8GQX8_9BURK